MPDAAETESALLQACQEAIIQKLSYDHTELSQEPDEQATADTGSVRVVLMPENQTIGPTHEGDQARWDIYFAIKITVGIRSTDTSRDRERELLIDTSLFAAHARSLNQRLSAIRDVLDGQWFPHMERADEILTDSGDTAANGLFMEPLRMTGIDPKPRRLSGEFFDATGDHEGWGRSIMFGRARRIRKRTLLTA